MSEAFRLKYLIPQQYEVPEDLQFNYMIHFICKTHGISKHAAGKYKEEDFWELLAFENLDNLKQEYLMKEYLNK